MQQPDDLAAVLDALAVLDGQRQRAATRRDARALAEIAQQVTALRDRGRRLAGAAAAAPWGGAGNAA